jgi:hypothetical protein
MIFAGCQINPIDFNFHPKKRWEIFDRNSADKISSKKDKEIKVSTLMPIRIKPECIYNSHYGNGVPAMFTSQCCPAER